MPDLDMPAPRPVAQGRRTLPFAGLPIGRHGGDAAGGVVGGVAGAGNWFLASSLGAGGGSSTSTQISMAMPTGNVGIVQASPYSSPMLATEGVAEGGAAAPLVANSIKGGETGRIFKNMVDAQVYAERTGRSDFEESTEEVKVGCEQRAHCVCVCVCV